jgi:hypothetical protein
MMKRPSLAVVAAAFVLAGVALGGMVFAQDAAQPAPPGSDDSRYTFHRVGDSFVRLDGRTGYVSVCGRESAGWACRVVPDERTALEESIGRLQGDNATLKKELLTRGIALPSGVRADPPAVAEADKAKPSENPSAKVPSDAEMDRVLGFIEKVWRRLVEIMIDLQRDMQRKG